MKPISGKRLGKILEKRGWVLDRTKGSHAVYKRPGHVGSIAVPIHGNHDLRTGTQVGIMRQAGLTAADL